LPWEVISKAILKSAIIVGGIQGSKPSIHHLLGTSSSNPKSEFPNPKSTVIVPT
jgi:hypothetical protein